MSALDRIIAALSTLLEHLRQAADAGVQAIDRAEEGLELAVASGLGQAIGAFGRLRDAADQLGVRVAALTDAAEEVLAQAHALGEGRGVTVPSQTLTPAALAARPPGRFRREIAVSVRPRRTQQTFGAATDADGRRLHDGELVSGHPRHAPVDPRSGIRDARTAALIAVSMHVEGQVAAMMRQPGAPSEVVLYLNNEVCRGRGRGRGCHEVLPGILPSGARLTVHTVEGGRRINTQVYEGNGSEL
jgi:hypothetical protein